MVDWKRWTDLRDEAARQRVAEGHPGRKGEIDQAAFKAIGARIANGELATSDGVIEILKSDRPPFWIAHQWFNEALRQFEARATTEAGRALSPTVAERDALRMTRVAYVSVIASAAILPATCAEAEAACDRALAEAAKHWEFYSRLGGPTGSYLVLVETLHKTADRLDEVAALYRHLQAVVRTSFPGDRHAVEEVEPLLVRHHATVAGMLEEVRALALQAREAHPAPASPPPAPEEEWASQPEPEPANPPPDTRTATERLKDLDF